MHWPIVIYSAQLFIEHNHGNSFGFLPNPKRCYILLYSKPGLVKTSGEIILVHECVEEKKKKAGWRQWYKVARA